jgi:hypothetical protein
VGQLGARRQRREHCGKRRSASLTDHHGTKSRISCRKRFYDYKTNYLCTKSFSSGEQKEDGARHPMLMAGIGDAIRRYGRARNCTRASAKLFTEAVPDALSVALVLAIGNSGEEHSRSVDLSSGKPGGQPLLVLLNQRPGAIQNSLPFSSELEGVHAPVLRAPRATNPSEPLESACNRHQRRPIDSAGIGQGILTEARIQADQHQSAVLTWRHFEPGQHVREHLKEA